MKILYFNNCWFTNVGEAFIDIGGMELTKRIFGSDCKLGCLSAMTDYYISNAPSIKKNIFKRDSHKDLSFNTSDYLNSDFVIIPGMVGTIEYLNAPSCKMVDKLVKKGCKPVFLGLGGERYDEEETEAVKRYFDRVKPALITTRDDFIYEQYKDVAPCVRAIDCAFWTVDVFDPRGFGEENYEVVAFNRIEEPKEFVNYENVVRPWHMQYQFCKELANDSVMISDTPYDYLTIYANAKKVYTDLVHATIVSLMYGTPVKYWENGKRFKAFYALNDLRNTDNFLYVPENSLSLQKERIIKDARRIIESARIL